MQIVVFRGSVATFCIQNGVEGQHVLVRAGQGPHVVAVEAVEPDGLPLGGDGEAETWPPGSAELAPVGVGVLDDAPQRVRPGFPDGAGAVVIAVRADFAPGAVGGVQHRVPRWLVGAITTQAEGGAARERGVREEPERALLPGSGQI